MTDLDMTDTIIPRSDQLNAEDLLSAPRTVTITEVRRGSSEQPVEIVTEEFGNARPFKPSKTVRRILVAAWGKEASAYVGRRLTLYRDPAVKFGGMDVGGIRVSHMSHIDKPLSIALTVTRGKRAPHVVKPLTDEPVPKQQRRINPDSVVKSFAALGVTIAQLEQKVERNRPDWDDDDTARLADIGRAIKNGDTTVEAEFATGGAE